MPFPAHSGYTAGVNPNNATMNYIPQLYAKELLVKFYQATVFGSIANTNYEGIISAMGDKVIIRTTPSITINNYELGQTLSVQNPTSASVDLKIDKGKYFAFNIRDVEEKQADINYVEKWAADASEQMKIAIDSGILGDVYADVAAANKGLTAGAKSGAVNLGVASADGANAIALTKSNIIDKIVECGQVLTEQNVPETGRWIVIPAWAETRLKTSELKDASVTGDSTSPLRNGRIGRLDKFDIYVSNAIPGITETAVTSYPILFGHSSALTFASQLTKIETIPNPTDFGKIMRGLQVYGYEMIKPDAAGVLYAKAG